MPNRDPNRPLYCWDAGVFISWLSDGDDLCKNDWMALQLVEAEITSNKADLITSVVSQAEVLHACEDMLSRFYKFMDHPNCGTMEVGDVLAREAGRIRQHFRARDRGLPLADALYVATAGLYDATHLHTFDRSHLLRINGQVPEHSFTICKPIPTVKEEKTKKRRPDKNQIEIPEATDGEDETPEETEEE